MYKTMSILNLPADTLLHMVSYIDVPERYQLALTCKSLFQVLWWQGMLEVQKNLIQNHRVRARVKIPDAMAQEGTLACVLPLSSNYKEQMIGIFVTSSSSPIPGSVIYLRWNVFRNSITTYPLEVADLLPQHKLDYFITLSPEEDWFVLKCRSCPNLHVFDCINGRWIGNLVCETSGGSTRRPSSTLISCLVVAREGSLACALSRETKTILVWDLQQLDMEQRFSNVMSGPTTNSENSVYEVPKAKEWRDACSTSTASSVDFMSDIEETEILERLGSQITELSLVPVTEEFLTQAKCEDPIPFMNPMESNAECQCIVARKYPCAGFSHNQTSLFISPTNDMILTIALGLAPDGYDNSSDEEPSGSEVFTIQFADDDSNFVYAKAQILDLRTGVMSAIQADLFSEDPDLKSVSQVRPLLFNRDRLSLILHVNKIDEMNSIMIQNWSIGRTETAILEFGLDDEMRVEHPGSSSEQHVAFIWSRNGAASELPMYYRVQPFTRLKKFCVYAIELLNWDGIAKDQHSIVVHRSPFVRARRLSDTIGLSLSSNLSSCMFLVEDRLLWTNLLVNKAASYTCLEIGHPLV